MDLLSSVAKPWQTRVFLESGAPHDRAFLAVICSSHSGTREHIDHLQRGLDRAGLSPRCTGAQPRSLRRRAACCTSALEITCHVHWSRGKLGGKNYTRSGERR